jgi:hypothetical protein
VQRWYDYWRGFFPAVTEEDVRQVEVSADRRATLLRVAVSVRRSRCGQPAESDTRAMRSA